MTMKGMGADEVLYGNKDRFQSFQFNLGIPLFAGANKAKEKR